MSGVDADLVRAALGDSTPLPGTGGFAGRLDGALVRDVLGRRPVFSEADDPTVWSDDPTDLVDPDPVPAGCVRDGTGDRRVWTLPSPPASDSESAGDTVESAVRTSVESVDADGLAVAFSGGVDSAVVAAGVPEAPCYVAGFPGSHDVAAARDAADAMGRELRVVELTHDDLERAVPEISRATGRANAMDVAIALPLYLVAECVAADGYDRLALGQGADELFGGYAKVVDPAEDHRVDADTVRGATREVVASLPDQLTRDVLTLRAAGVEPVTPLLHDRVVDAALRLPDDLLVSGDERKVALRQAARGLVPESVRTADKKAVQYGTYASRELDRLARQAGFKRRMDDHVGQYVESLLEE
ncbi:asparagine synthase C-terminal domain-containing protein [Halobium salinum]|uniref:Asparagine synthase C-terminal domain-containing protein n=1 Tax=Halobium salinum TaxID=1364940 RepID=A0ABD5PDB3_9EURY|nr:asparagine synthase-related protein [Halobium salinum]